MSEAFVYRKRVEFADTDMAGIVHFSRFFVYMEMAEHAFWRSLGLSVHGPVNGDMIGWPRVDAHCEYLKPLRFEEEVDICVTVVEIAEKTVTVQFRFGRANASDRHEVAQGTLKLICVRVDPSDGQMSAVAIPEEIRRKLSEYQVVAK